MQRSTMPSLSWPLEMWSFCATCVYSWMFSRLFRSANALALNSSSPVTELMGPAAPASVRKVVYAPMMVSIDRFFMG